MNGRRSESREEKTKDFAANRLGSRLAQRHAQTIRTLHRVNVAKQPLVCMCVHHIVQILDMFVEYI